jgi:phosphoribosylformylglycinamidine synthase
VLDIGDGQTVVLRLEARGLDESPREAAARTAAGVVADVLAMGATPLAVLDGLRLDRPESGRSHVLRDAVSGISEVTRAMSLPALGGCAEIGPDQPGEVALLSIGTAPRDALSSGRASGLGSKVLYVGAKCFEPMDPAIAPRLAQALQRALASGAVEGCEDIDVGGIAAAALDMAARAQTGIDLDVDLVPSADADASHAQILTYEAPLRFLVVAKRGREDAVLNTFEQAGVPAVTIGVVTNTQRFVCKAIARGEGQGKPSVVADLSVSALTSDAPRNERAPEPSARDASAVDLPHEGSVDLERELLRLLGSAAGGGRDWIQKQLGVKRDGQGPSDAAFIAIPSGDDKSPEKHLAVSLDSNSRTMELDARAGAALLVAECARNLACSGAEPMGLLDALLLSAPETGQAAHLLSEAVEGLREASIALKVPVVGGHVRTLPGTPRIAATIGVVGQLRSADDRLSIGFKRQADMIALLGSVGQGNMSGSLWLKSRGASGTKPLSIDLGAEVKLQRVVLELARERLLSSAHDVSDGGLGLCVAECCVAGRIGCSIELPSLTSTSRLAMMFHEEPSRVIVSFPPEHRERVQQHAEGLGVPFCLLGFVGGDTMEIEDILDTPVPVLADCHARALDDLTDR